MPDTVITKSLALTDDEARVGTQDNPLVEIEISGTWAGTLNIESALDPDNILWAAAPVFTVAGAAHASTITANGRFMIQAADAGLVRARLNPATSGSPLVTLRAGDNETFGIGGTGGGGGGGAVTVTNPGDFVDGWDATQGLTTSAGITTDINGTAQGFRRGNIKMWLNYLARFPAALGSTTASASLPVTLSTDGQFVTSTGSLTETAPATDIASSGLNGRLQRIAQRLTTLIGTNLLTQGDVAHGSADSGNPNKMGFVAIAHGTNPTAVAAARRTNAYANRAGVPFGIGGHPNVQTVTANFTAAQTDFALVTVATGLVIVVTGFMVTCSSANTVNTSVTLGFGAANVPTLTANTAVAAVFGSHPGIAPGSGFARGGGSGMLGVGADDADLRATVSVPTSGSVSVTVTYYTIES